MLITRVNGRLEHGNRIKHHCYGDNDCKKNQADIDPFIVQTFIWIFVIRLVCVVRCHESSLSIELLATILGLVGLLQKAVNKCTFRSPQVRSGLILQDLLAAPIV